LLCKEGIESSGMPVIVHVDKCVKHRLFVGILSLAVSGGGSRLSDGEVVVVGPGFIGRMVRRTDVDLSQRQGRYEPTTFHRSDVAPQPTCSFRVSVCLSIDASGKKFRNVLMQHARIGGVQFPHQPTWLGPSPTRKLSRVGWMPCAGRPWPVHFLWFGTARDTINSPVDQHRHH
jgi:hypothetical protein